MSRRCGANGLMLPGLIVILIGLGVVLMRTLAVPGEWTTVVIGLALVGAGLARRALRSGDGT
jgi:hypothetical protein